MHPDQAALENYQINDRYMGLGENGSNLSPSERQRLCYYQPLRDGFWISQFNKIYEKLKSNNALPSPLGTRDQETDKKISELYTVFDFEDNIGGTWGNPVKALAKQVLETTYIYLKEKKAEQLQKSVEEIKLHQVIPSSPPYKLLIELGYKAYGWEIPAKEDCSRLQTSVRMSFLLSHDPFVRTLTRIRLLTKLRIEDLIKRGTFSKEVRNEGARTALGLKGIIDTATIESFVDFIKLCYNTETGYPQDDVSPCHSNHYEIDHMVGISSGLAVLNSPPHHVPEEVARRLLTHWSNLLPTYYKRNQAKGHKQIYHVVYSTSEDPNEFGWKFSCLDGKYRRNVGFPGYTSGIRGIKHFNGCIEFWLIGLSHYNQMINKSMLIAGQTFGPIREEYAAMPSPMNSFEDLMEENPTFMVKKEKPLKLDKKIQEAWEEADRDWNQLFDIGFLNGTGDNMNSETEE